MVDYDERDDDGFCPNAAWFGWRDTIVYCAGYSDSPDVVGHEITHGVTETTANLNYSGMSGALNEHFSDVFGVALDREDWLLGEDTPVGILRDLANPAAFGLPEHFSDYRWNITDDNGGVHTNSSIPDKAFALLVDGGTFHGVTVAGIGRDKAERIWYRTLTRHLHASSIFDELAYWTAASCQELVPSWGITAYDCEQVAHTFEATGIPTDLFAQ